MVKRFFNFEVYNKSVPVKSANEKVPDIKNPSSGGGDGVGGGGESTFCPP